VQTITLTGASGTWLCPLNILPGSLIVQCTGESGAAASDLTAHKGSGGAGAGAFAQDAPAVTGGLTYSWSIGQGATGNHTVFTGDSLAVSAAPGGNGAGIAPGSGGAAGSNAIAYAGGSGGNGSNSTTGTGYGGGGGGAAGPGGPGGAGGPGSGASPGAGGTPGTGGGAGGAGGASSTAPGSPGTVPGGGPGGGSNASVAGGGPGTPAAGWIILTWSVIPAPAIPPQPVPPSQFVPMGFGGYQAPPSPQPPSLGRASVVNQWSATFSQPAVFGSMPPALQSTVVQLTPATSAGSGSGTPSAGNWLVCLMGWQQGIATSAVTFGDADDIHSFWRPASPSSSAGSTRCAGWYTANLARTAADVYCAPNGAVAGAACLVVEISGIGPWDSVTAVSTAYSAATTSLGLSFPAPSGQALVIAGVCGDNDSAGQGFLPPGWTPLATVTATNGANHAGDAVLTSACYATTGALSVTATASAATDLSGFIIGFLFNAPSPIPAGANAAWAGRTILEAGFGSGFQTPADEIEWTTLSDSAADPLTTIKRLWGYQETTGVQYQRGQIQTTEGTVSVDNFDGNLSPSSESSPYYPYCLTGTPVRLRFALGGTANRWYVISRNAKDFPEQRTSTLRNWVSLGVSDIWATASGPCPSPYRAEVYQDSPGWWWPCDDQALAGGVLPVQLRNAAPGNTNPLLIKASPNGIPYQDLCGFAGSIYGSATDLTASAEASTPPTPSVAVYQVGQQPGWMYGDPQSSPSAVASAGGAITASPGAAAWQQTGLLGETGSYGWWLACEDTYPPLASGVSIEAWASAGFLASSQGFTSTGGSIGYFCIAAQPCCPLTILSLTTATLPVAVLQLNGLGNLVLITYAAGTSTGTTHSIYTGSDLRCNAFVSYSVQLTTTTWSVQVNGGLTATASGTCTAMTSQCTWLTACGDLGTGGGSSPAGLAHGGNMALSHISIYPRILPQARILAHYTAAVTGFGLLPAPTSPGLSSVQNLNPTGFTPDGTCYEGNYGPGGDPWSLSLVTASLAGNYTSGPSARTTLTGMLGDSLASGSAVWAAATALAPGIALYTSANAGAEEEAAVILGAGDSMTSGYGTAAVSAGVCAAGAGSGASPPTVATPLGDTAGQRIERAAGYGGMTVPNRAIDIPQAVLAVQAALDVGGQQCGQAMLNIAQSDGGFMSIDNNGTLCYRSRPHLAADTPAWTLGPLVSEGMIPYKPSQQFQTDPTRVWNPIVATPYDPAGATLPDLTPANAAGVAAGLIQYGARAYPFTSYLQSLTEIQAYVNWLFENYGQNRRRVALLEIDAAGYPAAWPAVLAMNVGDLATVYDMSVSGAPSSTGIYRVTQIRRSISYGANKSQITGSITCLLDYEPSEYWS